MLIRKKIMRRKSCYLLELSIIFWYVRLEMTISLPCHEHVKVATSLLYVYVQTHTYTLFGLLCYAAYGKGKIFLILLAWKRVDMGL